MIKERTEERLIKVGKQIEQFNTFKSTAGLNKVLFEGMKERIEKIRNSTDDSYETVNLMNEIFSTTLNNFEKRTELLNEEIVDFIKEEVPDLYFVSTNCPFLMCESIDDALDGLKERLFRVVYEEII